jgi:hypothetical protein
MLCQVNLRGSKEIILDQSFEMELVVSERIRGVGLALSKVTLPLRHRRVLLLCFKGNVKSSEGALDSFQILQRIWIFHPLQLDKARSLPLFTLAQTLVEYSLSLTCLYDSTSHTVPSVRIAWQPPEPRYRSVAPHRNYLQSHVSTGPVMLFLLNSN